MSIFRTSQQHTFSADIAADCVKNFRHTQVCLQILALSSFNIISKKRLFRGTENALRKMPSHSVTVKHPCGGASAYETIYADNNTRGCRKTVPHT